MFLFWAKVKEYSQWIALLTVFENSNGTLGTNSMGLGFLNIQFDS